jgi:preprotein translocase subunit SecD
MRITLVAFGVVLLLGATACGTRDEQATDEKSRRFVLRSDSKVSSEEIDAVVSVMRKRLDDLGGENAKVERDGDRIVVTLSRISRSRRIARRPGGSATVPEAPRATPEHCRDYVRRLGAVLPGRRGRADENVLLPHARRAEDDG